ncbi:hypothetical protein PVAG01_07745 [Phlyctema vagabunda]|uniref:Uncharacterized protein n=1 Tax=Phlyctema vagabunda TaxID=108571 RepID=A0ABR4PDA3_9HELO
MQSMASQPAQPHDDEETYRQLESYHWDRDTEFQGGLSAILGNTTSPAQVEELTYRAQCYYFSRKKLNGAPINFDGYKAYMASRMQGQGEPPATVGPSPVQEEHPPTSAEDPKQAPYPQTFSDIVALITSGAPIPGIKDIPPTLLTDQATKPVASKRRKPWEKEANDVNDQGTFGDRRDDNIQQEYPEAV